MKRLATALLPVAVVVVTLQAPAGAAAPRSFADCLARVDAAPDDLEAYRCYWMLSRRLGAPRDALEALDVLAARRGEDPRIDLYRGAILADLEEPTAGERLAAAAAGCEELAEWTCAVYGRLSLAWQRRRDPQLAWHELDAARDAAERGSDPTLAARVDLGRGWRAIEDLDFAAARVELATAGRALLPDGPFDARFSLLDAEGFVAWSTYRLDEALERYRDAEAAARGAGDPFALAQASYNALLVERHREIMGLGPPVGLGRLEEALAAAVAAGNQGVESSIRLQIAQADVSRERREAELDRVLAVGGVEDAVSALLVRRNRLAEEGDAEGAQAALDRATVLVQRTHSTELALRLCFRGTMLLSDEGRAEEARQTALGCLEQLEGVLARQPLALDRWGLSWQYQLGLYDFADRLTRQGDVELGLQAIERLRTRSVLAGLAAGTSSDELGTVRRQLSALQGRLYRLAEADPGRDELARRLESLEAREVQLVRQLGAASEGTGPLPSIGALLAALDPGSAILSFQIAPWRGEAGASRSWLVVLDATGPRVYPLPAPEQVAVAVRAFNGLLGRRGPALREAAESLFEELLGSAITDLPATVRRLIVVPDGPVHELPLAALRQPGIDGWLGERFEIVRVPSLAAWLAARPASGAVLPAEALSLADPTLEATAVWTPSPERLGSVEISGLGRLPEARREAESLRSIYRGSIVLVGPAASEAALKRADLSGVGLVHLAAHALVDPQRPHRSAILLAPGDGEDGLLQMRDIAALHLSGAIVVLAACRSADGTLPGGPGVFSLARAFLDAGAEAVVANLQPVGDADAHELMLALFAELGRGRGVAAALARARRRAARVRPPEAWATTVLLGDGEAHLAAAPHRGGTMLPVALLVLFSVALLAGWRWPGPRRRAR